VSWTFLSLSSSYKQIQEDYDDNLLVGVFPDILVGVVELDEQDDGDRLQVSVAFFVLRLAGHRATELGKQLGHDDGDTIVDTVLVHLKKNV
jgi:hypothetical protein